MKGQQIHRARWHDYRSRCIYMITITKQPGKPSFSYLTGDYRIPTGSQGCSATTPTHLGEIIQRGIKAIPRIEPAIKLLQYSIMPDHAHILLFVQRPIIEPIGLTIARMKAEISHTYGTTGIFNEGFNDQILKPSRKLQVIYDYIRDNPRRLAVRQAMPDFFRRINTLTINGRGYQAYGNLQLLDNPFKEQVVVHRADSPEKKMQMRDLWLYTAANGGVLVSPFISPAEKAIRTEAEEAAGRIILITHLPFPARYKPPTHDFDLCCQGRLLIIAPAEASATSDLSRTACLAMNTLAANISLA